MWPWAHAAVGYLAYSLFTRVRSGTPPEGPAAIVAVAATQIPDLVDKPLAWTFEVLPAGRSLGHSLFTVVVVVGIASVLFHEIERGGLTTPLAIGYLSGVLSDLPPAVFRGEFEGATYLLWPLLSSPSYYVEPSFLAHLQAMEVDGRFLFQGAVAAVVFLLWLVDGRPGVCTAREALRVLVADDYSTD